jgi:hypothetical protein
VWNPFAQGVDDDQMLQLRQHLAVPAELQQGVDALLDRRQPQLVDALHIRLGELLVRRPARTATWWCPSRPRGARGCAPPERPASDGRETSVTLR